jgi:poly-gamma-glutamate synthesis protein (capsule biosynthesis protein)
MRNFFTLMLFAVCGIALAQQVTPDSSSITLLFMGDIMGHQPQIESAYNKTTNSYDYTNVFAGVSSIISKADYAIANLEVTLAGKPYTGYPRFSSPDELAVGCKNAGINVLLTANNHSCDRAEKGVVRTVKVLDSLKILRTGSFIDSADRVANNLLILEKRGIRVGVLNYTFSLNGLPAPKKAIVNTVDTAIISRDIDSCANRNLDKLVVAIHWGDEYVSHPGKYQKKIANYLFNKGVDIIIGSHPHVVQTLRYEPTKDTIKERFIAYSLGNFVSNQRTRKRDGGLMVQLKLTKEGDNVSISDYGYHLTWVDKTITGGINYSILSCSKHEANNYNGLTSVSKEKLKQFVKDTRELLASDNILHKEVKYLKKERIDSAQFVSRMSKCCIISNGVAGL